MTINERIVLLREKLDIKQSDMSVSIGLKQGSLSDIERGKTKKVTERVINDICRVYGVNKDWLIRGIEPMIIPIDDKDEFERVWAQIANSKSDNADFIKRIMRAFWSLPEDKQAAVKELIDKVSEK